MFNPMKERRGTFHKVIRLFIHVLDNSDQKASSHYKTWTYQPYQQDSTPLETTRQVVVSLSLGSSFSLHRKIKNLCH